MMKVLLAAVAFLYAACPASAAPDFGGYVQVGAFDVALVDEARRLGSTMFLVIPTRCDGNPVFHCRYARSDKIMLAAGGESERSRVRFVRVACEGEKIDDLCDETIRVVMFVLDPDVSIAKQFGVLRDIYSTFAEKTGVARGAGMTAAYTLSRDPDNPRIILFDAIPRN